MDKINFKDGIQTSEWKTLIMLFVGIFGSVVTYLVSAGALDEKSIIVTIAGLLASVGGYLGYNNGRAKVKAAALQANAIKDNKVNP